MTERTLNIYGYKVPFDGVPLGIEVRAAEELQKGKASELENLEGLAVAIINARLFRHEPDKRISPDDLAYQPFTGIEGITAVMESVKAALAPKKAESGGKTQTNR